MRRRSCETKFLLANLYRLLDRLLGSALAQPFHHNVPVLIVGPLLLPPHNQVGHEHDLFVGNPAGAIGDVVLRAMIEIVHQPEPAALVVLSDYPFEPSCKLVEVVRRVLQVDGIDRAVAGRPLSLRSRKLLLLASDLVRLVLDCALGGQPLRCPGPQSPPGPRRSVPATSSSGGRLRRTFRSRD